MNIKSLRKVDTHGDLVASYVAAYPGTKAKGFERELRTLVAKKRRLLNLNLGRGEWSLEPIGFRPDAHLFDHKTDTLVLVEVEVTSFVTERKWRAIADLFFLLDAAEWDVELHLVDRYGVVHGVDLARRSIDALGYSGRDWFENRYKWRWSNRPPAELARLRLAACEVAP